MAEKQASDLFMIFCVNDGKALDGESQVELGASKDNELCKGFRPTKMFEIASFSFGLGGSQTSALEKHLKKLGAAAGSMPDLGKLAKSLAPKTDGSTDPTAVTEIRFSRMMDISSPILLGHMINRTYFDRVAILKRKAAGGPAGGTPFMRIDFMGVMLVDVSWSNGEPVKEDYAFQSRETTMRYRPQLEDGSLGDTIVGYKTLVPGKTEAPL